MIQPGVQLYTARELLEEEGAACRTLDRIRKIGYRQVQLFGSVELIEKHAGLAGAVGLEIIGVLTSLKSCRGKEEALFEVCRKYQIPDIGISSGMDDCARPEDYIKEVNAFAGRVRAAGFSFSYHNHGHEFIKGAAGKTAMELFLEGFDKKNVDFMPDTYWLHDGGCDVRHFLEKTKNRVSILHLKDLKRTAEGHTYAQVGEGNLYFEGIFETALACGIRHFVVEQDICEGDPLECLETSYQNIKAITEGM